MRERIPDRFFALDAAMVFERNTSMTVDPIGQSGLLACARIADEATPRRLT